MKPRITNRAFTYFLNFILVTSFMLLNTGSRVSAVSDTQVYSIYPFAGTGVSGSSVDGVLAVSATLKTPNSVAIDSVGNIYIAEAGNNRIRKVGPDGILRTIAGNGSAGYDVNEILATTAKLNSPYGVAVDSVGGIYIADTNNHRIRKVTTDGAISTIAGNGTAGYSGDGGDAKLAQLNYPYGVAIDPQGFVYIIDTSNSAIRKIGPNGIITTVAGTGITVLANDGAPATSIKLNLPSTIAFSADNAFYIADNNNHRILKVGPDGKISTVAGTGNATYSGDGGSATYATMNKPVGIARDIAGNIYFSDNGNNRIRRIRPDGEITTIAGTGISGSSGDGGIATAATLSSPRGLALDASGKIYFASETGNRVRVLVPDTLAPSLTAGAVVRTSDATASVKFTSNEAGQYYYTIVDSGTTPPSTVPIGATAQPCTVIETTISIVNGLGLTAGPKDIYIWVKDVSGNLSTSLMVSLPAYVPPDTTPPTLTAGSVIRTSDTTASVTFTSTELGQYYYAVVEVTDPVIPTINTGGSGISFSTTSAAITINFTTLSAGAKKVYVQAKDASGNLSTSLMIGLPAYVPPDTTPPILDSVTATRTSDSTATVTFTSSESGQYYFAVVDATDSVMPTLNTTASGISFTTTSAAINLTSLTAGAKKVYIQVKDMSGNLSIPRDISVLAFVALSHDDDADTVSGMALGMEYKLDNADWIAYAQASFCVLNFAGNHTLQVRNASSVTPQNTQGEITTLTFTVYTPKIISGTIMLPNGETVQSQISGSVQISTTNGAFVKSAPFVIQAGANSAGYSISVPQEAAVGDYLVSYDIGSNGSTTYVPRGYYAGAVTTVLNGATPISAVGEIAAGVDLTLLKGLTISGTIVLPNEASAPSGGILGQIVCEAQNGMPGYYTNFTIPSGVKQESYRIVVPNDPSVAGYTVQYKLNNLDNNTYAQRGYFSKSGTTTLSLASLVTVNGTDVAAVNLTLLSGYTISGTIALPDGVYVSGLSGTVIVSPLNSSGGATEQSYGYEVNPYYGEFSFSYGKPSVTYTTERIPLDPTVTDYQVRYNIKSSDLGFVGTGYYTAAGTTSLRSQDAGPVSISDGNKSNINLSLLPGKKISGKIALPAGTAPLAIASSGTVYVHPPDGRKPYSTYFYLPPGASFATYTVSVPDEVLQFGYRLSYTLEQNPGKYVGAGYYTGAGMIGDATLATLIPGTNAGISLVDLSLNQSSGTPNHPHPFRMKAERDKALKNFKVNATIERLASAANGVVVFQLMKNVAGSAQEPVAIKILNISAGAGSKKITAYFDNVHNTPTETYSVKVFVFDRLDTDYAPLSIAETSSIAY